MGSIVMPTVADEPTNTPAPARRADSDLDGLSPRSRMRAINAKKLDQQKAAMGLSHLGGQMGRAPSGPTYQPPTRQTRDARDGVWMHGLQGPIQDRLRGAVDPRSFDGLGVSVGGEVDGKTVDQKVVGTSIAPAAQDPTQHVATHLLSDAATFDQLDKFYRTDDKRHIEAFYEARCAALEKDIKQTAAIARQAEQGKADTPVQAHVDERARAPAPQEKSKEELRRLRLEAMEKRHGSTPLP